MGNVVEMNFISAGIHVFPMYLRSSLFTGGYQMRGGVGARYTGATAGPSLPAVVVTRPLRTPLIAAECRSLFSQSSPPSPCPITKWRLMLSQSLKYAHSMTMDVKQHTTATRNTEHVRTRRKAMMVTIGLRGGGCFQLEPTINGRSDPPRRPSRPSRDSVSGQNPQMPCLNA